MTTMSVTLSPAYLAMPDAVNVNLLPAGYPAYLGYVDGEFATGKQLAIRFPEAELVILTVTGADGAHGVRVAPGTDVEPGDLLAMMGVFWAAHELHLNPAARPVIYASVQGEPGYGMPDVLHNLAHDGIDRSRVRLLSAHYGAGPHICGPKSCGLVPVDMDGTQWTSDFEGRGYDMSLLRPDFFTTPAPETETERLVRELGIVRQGDTGSQVKTVQGLLAARGYPVLLDGIFGPATFKCVATVQARAMITADGVVGPLTWPVLLGVA